MTVDTRDPLASWRDGAIKSALTRFVREVTDETGRGFVAPAERIAVFDNDGTLWNEFPQYVQVLFTLSEVKRLTAKDPSLLAKPAYKAMVDGDLKTLSSLPKRELLEPGFAVHAGMTIETFAATVSDWLATARHSGLGTLLTSNTYRPQRDLMDHLRKNGFKVFIVTGGGVEFVRVVSDKLYAVPPEQVVGSSTKASFEWGKDGAHVRKQPNLGSFNDREEKPVNIALHIGRRPIFAFGNSDGDLAMLRYTLDGPGQRMAMLLHHDDAVREFAYDRDFKLSPLKEALDCAEAEGISVVSMAHDWNVVFD